VQLRGGVFFLFFYLPSDDVGWEGDYDVNHRNSSVEPGLGTGVLPFFFSPSAVRWSFSGAADVGTFVHIADRAGGPRRSFFLLPLFFLGVNFRGGRVRVANRQTAAGPISGSLIDSSFFLFSFSFPFLPCR